MSRGSSRRDASGAPRLADVAARAGVSISTASLAFGTSGPVSVATRERVRRAAEELGYAGPDPRARSLRRGRSGVVAVVLEDPMSAGFRDPMNLALLDGIAEAFESTGTSLLIVADAIDDPSRLATAPLDAAVLLGCSLELETQLAPLQARGVPIVAVEAPPIDGVIGVDLENREASVAAARHLHELGHRRVATITLPLARGRAEGPVSPEAEAGATVRTAIERLAGARAVFPDLDAVSARDSSVDAGMRTAGSLLDRAERPTAILAQSDLLALGVIREAGRLGIRVPEELSVVGFDGASVEGTDHVLTTLVQPAVEKGIAAGRAVLGALRGDAVPSVVFRAELRIGTTTATPS